ncbi:MAG: YjjG family noncanonical pyrimidine nucleotidase [Crocinitomicaceae bacterium]|nr:YjjG family noncanonical pyrimidine nucleotidase [Crocinitomicaceae bacterium]
MKHLFFDLDHTLWDFETNSKIALDHIYAQLNLDERMRSFQSFYTTYKKINGKLWNSYGQGKITKDVLRVKRFDDTLKSFQVNDRALAEEIAELYVGTSPYQTQLFPGTKEVLTELEKDFELHIITNGFKEIQHIKLENSGILHHFDVIVCSEDIGKNKPAPEIFHHAMERAKTVASESLMIGDNYKTDIVGATRAGIPAILFDPHRSYRDGIHEWHIHTLDRIPDLIPWIRQSLI